MQYFNKAKSKIKTGKDLNASLKKISELLTSTQKKSQKSFLSESNCSKDPWGFSTLLSTHVHRWEGFGTRALLTSTKCQECIQSSDKARVKDKENMLPN